MYRVLVDFTAQYDYRFIVAVLLIGTAASFFIFTIYARGLRSETNPFWFVLAGACVSISMWGLHHAEMLFFQPPNGLNSHTMFNPLSLFIAIAFSSTGFLIARHGGLWRPVVGGALIGIAITALHFSGLASLILPGNTPWNDNVALTAIVIGAIFSAAALIAYHKFGRGGIIVASAFLALAIGSLHFLALTALGELPSPAKAPLEPMLHMAPIGAIIAGAIGLAAGGVLVSMWLYGRSKLRASLHMRELVDAALEGLIVARQGRIVHVNRRLTQLCSMSEKELVGKLVFGDLFDAPSPRTALAESFTADMRMKVKGSGEIPVEVARRPLSQSAANQTNEVYAIRDLREWNRAADALRRINTELKQREEELRMQNMRFDVALSSMSQGLSMFDANQRLVVCNEQYARIYGLAQDDVKPGSSLKAILQACINNGSFSGSSPENYIKERLQSVTQSEETIQILNDGRMVAVKRCLMPEGGWVSTHEDITDKRRVEARIAYLAQHDPLTNLANRAYLTEQLDKSALQSGDGQSSFAVVMLDLDRFKEVNDTLGHFVGDGLLRSVSERLGNCVRKTATLARFGGDEFAILEQTNDPDVEASALAKRILASLREPFEIEGHIVSTGTSIGIAVAPRDSTDPDELLKCADLALYQAKAEARGTYRFYDGQMKKRMEERRALEHDLRLALSRGEFTLHYQAIVDAATSQITGFEALIRWEHPERGRVPPDVFIPIAEETGLINKIGKWVMRRACTEATTWPAHFKVAVNLSVKQFKSPGLVPSVAHVLMDTGLEPHRLELEITESVMLKDAEDAFMTLAQLHELGVRISLDDFGTGFSTLSYLRRFHFDKIKIDRSFIRDLSTGNDALVIVRSILALGKGLGITTTAEGVETKEQLDIMRDEGCTEIQGYYFSPPLPSEEIRSLFETPPESLSHNVA